LITVRGVSYNNLYTFIQFISNRYVRLTYLSLINKIPFVTSHFVDILLSMPDVKEIQAQDSGRKYGPKATLAQVSSCENKCFK